MTRTTKPPSPLAFHSDWLRIILMGSFLAAVIYMAFFFQPAGAVDSTGISPVYEDATPVPELSAEILAEANDQSRTARLQTEMEPLKHLLEESLRVTPGVAQKLGMPSEPVPVAHLRDDPNRYRGKLLWYKGQLEYLSDPKPGHPVPTYNYYEGRLKTSEGNQVLFAFSLPPSEDVVIGDWVRIEGFFLKLRDAHLPVALDMAPMLVGPAIVKAYADWEAIEAIDPAVLARVRDGHWDGNEFVGGPDTEKMLSESQDVPLWHVASYALHRNEQLTLEQKRAVPTFVTKEQFEKFKRGKILRGTPMRLLGTFVEGRIMPAHVNPLGIEAWTEVWIQVRDLGGKTIPVWIAGRIDHDWKRNQPAVCNAYFFKGYRYPTAEGEERWTPLFVAASLERFVLPGNSLTNPITFAFVGLVSIVGIVFFFMWRRDRRQSSRHADLLVNRRRRRRSKDSEAAPEQPCTS